jgi:hypothetical protein
MSAATGTVIDFLRQLHVLVPNYTRDDNRIHADPPHGADNGVPEIMPAADLYPYRGGSRMQMPPTRIPQAEQRSLPRMENPLLPMPNSPRSFRLLISYNLK